MSTDTIELPNMNEIEEASGGSRLPDGWNRVTVRHAATGKSNKNNPQIELDFDNDYGNGRDRIVVTPAAMPFVKQKLGAMGVEFPDNEFTLNVKALVGKTMEVLIVTEPGFTDPTKSYAVVKAYRPAIGPAPIPSGLNGGSTGVEPDFPSSPPPAEDNIPF